MPLDRVLAATAGDVRGPLSQLGDEGFHSLASGRKELRVALDCGRQDGHRISLAVRSDRGS